MKYELASMIDHTLLKPEAAPAAIERLCEEAAQYHFASVCVQPSYVKLAAQCLQGSPVKVCTVIGFPLGVNQTSIKAYEAAQAVKDGAEELDMVLHIGALKSRDDEYVYKDIKAVVEAASGKVVKVILETGYLSSEEKQRACRIVKDAGAHFVKTSTGFGPGGATVEDIALMRETVGPDFGVKASGGVRTSEDAMHMIKAGANRIGTSAGPSLVLGARENI
jgi:deoxyribose-phosphate aldolase